MAQPARDYVAQLYATLHEMDRQSFDWIAVEPPPPRRNGPDPRSPNAHSPQIERIRRGKISSGWSPPFNVISFIAFTGRASGSFVCVLRRTYRVAPLRRPVCNVTGGSYFPFVLRFLVRCADFASPYLDERGANSSIPTVPSSSPS